MGGVDFAQLCRVLGNLRIALGGAALPSNMENTLCPF
jgi:hypothetical protein